MEQQILLVDWKIPCTWLGEGWHDLRILELID